MNFHDLPARILSIRIRRTDGATGHLLEQPVLSVQAREDRPGEFDIHLQDQLFSARPVAGGDARRLHAAAGMGTGPRGANR